MSSVSSGRESDTTFSFAYSPELNIFTPHPTSGPIADHKPFFRTPIAADIADARSHQPQRSEEMIARVCAARAATTPLAFNVLSVPMPSYHAALTSVPLPVFLLTGTEIPVLPAAPVAELILAATHPQVVPPEQYRLRCPLQHDW